MQKYSEMSKAAAQSELERLESEYNNYKNLKLKLDMTRGKPCPAQLDMICDMGLERAYTKEELKATDSTDSRNYGVLMGLTEAREIFAEILKMPVANVLAHGNASLNLMYDCFTRAINFPLPGQSKAWGDPRKIKVLCPSPGYDRHFAIPESYGCELIYVPMTADGPDMDVIEALTASDESIKAMFVVPVYSNPEGIIFSEQTLGRMAAMKAAPDFRIFYDNAYVVHNLDPEHKAPKHDFYGMCVAAGHADRVLEFASTSKMTFAGAGISAMASSEDNIKWFLDGMKYQTIGPDKVRQLRHANFFKENGGIEAVMGKHAEILAPKFSLVLDKLMLNFADSDLVKWHEPKGGYFVSIDLLPGQAKAVVAAAKEAGVALTPAGATFPNGKDPLDRNIRIAPSFPETAELDTAMDVLCLCVKICALRAILA